MIYIILRTDECWFLKCSIVSTGGVVKIKQQAEK